MTSELVLGRPARKSLCLSQEGVQIDGLSPVREHQHVPLRGELPESFSSPLRRCHAIRCSMACAQGNIELRVAMTHFADGQEGQSLGNGTNRPGKRMLGMEHQWKFEMMKFHSQPVALKHFLNKDLSRFSRHLIVKRAQRCCRLAIHLNKRSGGIDVSLCTATSWRKRR